VRAAAAAALLFAAAPVAAGQVSWSPYGALKDGRKVSQFVLTNDRGMEVRLINYGAIVTDVVVPDAKGRRANVVLGFASLRDYEEKNGNYSFGAAMGRYAGRIADARFRIDGKEYRLAANNGPHTLHGGPGGFDTRLWTAQPYSNVGRVGAVMSYSSPAGEQGFPGKLDVTIIYTLTDDNRLRIDYEARTDAPTVLNLTNHSYFNLAGAGSGTVRDQLLTVAANRYVEIDGGGIPTGRFPKVDGTPFDFRRPVPIGTAMDRPHPQMEGHRGYNHAWLLEGHGRLSLAARLEDRASGRRMDVLTTEPSLQIYSGNWFSGKDVGAHGKPYLPHYGIALETQHLPDAPNRPQFGSTLLRPGQTFRSTTVFRFSASGR
jgi:aldose 1-epimerase